MRNAALTEDQFVALIRRTINDKFGGVQKDAAKDWGISPQYLGEVLARGRAPGRALYEALGYIRLTRYAKALA